MITKFLPFMSWENPLGITSLKKPNLWPPHVVLGVTPLDIEVKGRHKILQQGWDVKWLKDHDWINISKTIRPTLGISTCYGFGSRRMTRCHNGPLNKYLIKSFKIIHDGLMSLVGTRQRSSSMSHGEDNFLVLSNVVVKLEEIWNLPL